MLTPAESLTFAAILSLQLRESIAIPFCGNFIVISIVWQQNSTWNWLAMWCKSRIGEIIVDIRM